MVLLEQKGSYKNISHWSHYPSHDIFHLPPSSQNLPLDLSWATWMRPTLSTYSKPISVTTTCQWYGCINIHKRHHWPISQSTSLFLEHTKGYVLYGNTAAWLCYVAMYEYSRYWTVSSGSSRTLHETQSMITLSSASVNTTHAIWETGGHGNRAVTHSHHQSRYRPFTPFRLYGKII